MAGGSKDFVFTFKPEKPGLFAEEWTFHGTPNVGGMSFTCFTSTKVQIRKAVAVCGRGTFHGTPNVGGTSFTGTKVQILTAEVVCGVPAQSARNRHDVC